MKTELLAPVGNFQMLVAAVRAGADAVYFGLQEFTMRSTAKNFEINDLKKMREVCNSSRRKPKMYLTLNTIIYDKELKDLEKTIKKVKDKVDAIICWDLAVIRLCNKHGVPFFVSTQASVSNTESAKFYKKLGAKRIVPARELDLKQVKKLSKILPIEAFAHGAMCVSVSGRCFTSQFLFCKSANRGECIHPCRRSYEIKDLQEGYKLRVENNKVMSAKDLCMLPYIEEMKKAGVTGFKIEGRNRDPRYVEAVVRIYRKALDKKLSKEKIKRGMEELSNVYNRKFSSGFYLGKLTPKDFSDVEHSASKTKKHFVGKVLHFFPKINVATIKLVSQLKIGENIVIIGKTTGLEKMQIESMEKKKKPIKRGKKGDEIGIKLPFRVRAHDEVYVLKKSR